MTPMRNGEKKGVVNEEKKGVVNEENEEYKAFEWEDMNLELERQWYTMEEDGWWGEDPETKFIGDNKKYEKIEEELERVNNRRGKSRNWREE